MKTRNVPESWKRQWSKFMYCFFDYLPVKYEEYNVYLYSCQFFR